MTVRNVSEETHRALRVRPARNGRSTEAEVRSILEETVRSPGRLKIGSEIHCIAADIGGMDDLETSLARSEFKGMDSEAGS